MRTVIRVAVNMNTGIGHSGVKTLSTKIDGRGKITISYVAGGDTVSRDRYSIPAASLQKPIINKGSAKHGRSKSATRKCSR